MDKLPSPIAPRNVLFYGLVRQLGSSLLIGFFLLFQYGLLHQNYNITYGELVGIVVGYGLTIFLATFAAMALFCRTSDNEKAKMVIKTVTYVLVVALIVSALISVSEPLLAKNYNLLIPKLVQFFTQLGVKLFPVSGWVTGIISSLFMGDIIGALIFTAILAVFVAALILLVVKNSRNYYEDVLQVTEVSQSAITAQKEGNVGEAVGKKVKVGKIGIGKGQRSSVFFHKHTIENRRAGFLGISTASLITAVLSVAISIFMRRENFEGGLVLIFALVTYMQIFTFSLGRFPRELSKPYIYLIPEPPVKKLYYAVKESLIGSLIEACLIFIPSGIVLNAEIADIALLIVTKVSITLIFVAANLLLMRLFGAVQSKILTMVFYFLLLLVLALPGVLFSVLAMTFLPTIITPVFLPLIGDIVGNVLVAFFAMFLCRNILQYAELN